MERIRPPMESAWKNKLKKERDREEYFGLSSTVRTYILDNNALRNLNLSPEGKEKVRLRRDATRGEIEKSPELRVELASYLKRRKEIQESNRRSENRQYTGWGTVVKGVKKQHE